MICSGQSIHILIAIHTVIFGCILYCLSVQSYPPIEALECFVAAAGTLNFRSAASEVHLSAAAFGQRIRQLEEHFGIPLFTRTTRKVELSDAGRRLLPPTREILENIADLAPLVHDDDIVVERHITIGTRHELGLSWLTPMISQLEKAVPGAVVHLRFGDGEELLRLVRKGEIDAAVSSTRLADRRFSFEILHEEFYQMVASDELVKSADIDSIESLLNQTLIDADTNLPLATYWLDADKERAHMQFNSVRSMGTIGAIRDLVLRGQGVAVLPSYFVQKDVEHGRLQTIFSEKKLLSDHFRLLFSRNSRLTRVFEAFSEVMRNTPLR